MNTPNSSYISDQQTAILEPNAEYTFKYDDFEIVIKPNKFTSISFSTKVPQITFWPLEKFPTKWIKMN